MAAEWEPKMEPTRKENLFILSGASGVGKSTAAQILFQREEDYIVMESDLLWCSYYDTPQDGYRQYRETWMRLCAAISQCGRPVVLCGCGTPEQFEGCEARRLFSTIHYIAVVAGPDVLEERLRKGRGIGDEGWIKSSLDFNRWLRLRGGQTSPAMELVDNTDLTAEETAERIDRLIRERIFGAR